MTLNIFSQCHTPYVPGETVHDTDDEFLEWESEAYERVSEVISVQCTIKPSIFSRSWATLIAKRLSSIPAGIVIF